MGICTYGLYLLIATLVTGEGFGWHPWWIYAWLIFAGFCDFVAFNLRNVAFQSDASGFIALIGYIAVFYGFLADVFVFNSTMTWTAMGGALLIIAVTVATAVYKLKHPEPAKSSK